MKSVITSFLDYNLANLKDQVDLKNELNLDYLVLRKIKGLPIRNINEQDLISNLKRQRVLLVDPLLPRFNINRPSEVKRFETFLLESLEKLKKVNAKYFIYEIPMFADFQKDKDLVLNVVKKHVRLIKKYRLEVLIKPSVDHIVHTYRLILEQLKESDVYIIFDPVYLYLTNQAYNASFRILSSYIKVLIASEVDPLKAPRVITTGGFIPLTDIFKIFIKHDTDLNIVLDSGMVELVKEVETYSKLKTFFSKEKRHKIKIYNDLVITNDNLSTLSILNAELEILKIVFK